MASKEPSLIRSTKAFSVEIPEGSSSAKAKRSDIVAGELGEVGLDRSHFEELLSKKPLKQSSDTGSIDTQQAFAAEQVKADVYAHAQEDASHETMAGISPDHLHSPTGIGIATESHKDHLVGVAEEHANDRSIGIADEHAEDHLIGVTEDHDQDHVVGIGNDASNEHLLAISNEGLHDTHAALPTDTVEDHHASVAKDKFEDHLTTVPQDNISDTHSPLPDNATEDHHVAVAATEPVEPIPLFVSSNDDFPDDHMEIEAPPEEAINTQALTEEALVDHIEHVKEGKAKLAEAHLSADVPAPLLTPQAKPVTQPKQPQLVKKAPAVLTPEMVKQQKEALLARQHKMEEFHGRVDAIRKTVNDINSKLDHISPQEKKPH
jgi:polyhydroxyalkanoate synthesis regulator phasin